MTEPESKPEAPEPPAWQRGDVLPGNVGSGAVASAVQPTWRAIQSPWLVAALVFATLDIYALWWLGRTWWQLKQEDRDAGKRPIWHVLAILAVPVYGYFRFHAHMRTIVQVAATPEARSTLNPMAMTVAWILISVLSLVTFFSPFAPGWVPLVVRGLTAALFGAAQYGLNAAWSSLPGGTVRAQMRPLHWLLLGFGVILYTLALVGLAQVTTPPA